ncbi:hypothetical protein HNO88_003577 [Novosphingobium chloroacetimidivorans]|uniref:Uncharacterized protein n=1 Tax=Novosphingobium chloroacetimidivorans TaxID=1428314 RepID=A0A7W7KCY5_9SPHN|nr:hypothetical protein [Novosphingobium chloroacetimidivorans]MBB4860235.1 hypothetical protein [Novosphingobium chloroacetimidivorans]
MIQIRFGFVVLAGATIFIKQPAVACEPAAYIPTVAQVEQGALDHFREADSVYEGILLGRHDYDGGGKLLVLKAYKGRASLFQIVDLPGGSSCYGDITPFSGGVWAQKITEKSFDGFESEQTVRIWKKHGLVEAEAASPIRQFYLVFAVFVSTIFLGFALLWQRRRKTSY